MARGWESKAVEEYREEPRRAPSPPPDAAKALLERELASIELSRTRVLNDLKRAANPRHQAVLRAALQHLDRSIAALNPGAKSESKPK